MTTGYFYGTPVYSVWVVTVPTRKIVEGWASFFKDTRHESI